MKNSEKDPEIQHPVRAADVGLRPASSRSAAPARPSSCTSASTARASWYTRSTGPKRAPATGACSCAARNASPAARGSSSRRPWKARRRARPRLQRPAGRPAADDPRQHVRGNRVLRPGARGGPDHAERLLEGCFSGSAPRPRRRRGPAAPRGRRQRRRERRLGLGDHRQRPLARLLEGAGGGDPFAQLLAPARPPRARAGRTPRARLRARGRG